MFRTSTLLLFPVLVRGVTRPLIVESFKPSIRIARFTADSPAPEAANLLSLTEGLNVLLHI